MINVQQKLEDKFCMHGGQDEFTAAAAIIDNTLECVFGITLGDLLERYETEKNQPWARLEYVKDFYTSFPQCNAPPGGRPQPAYVLHLSFEGGEWEFSKAWFFTDGRLPIGMMEELAQLTSLNYHITFK